MHEAPFKVGGIVEPPYFIGRDEELSRLVEDARGLAQNVLVLAPRRYGKSSLLHNVRRRLADEPNLLTPYVNCREITSAEDFHRAAVSALLEAFERKRRVAGLLEAVRATVKEGVLTALRRVEEIGGSVSDVGRIYLRFREHEVDAQELLRAAFRFFAAFCIEKEVRAVFVMDEFQEVASFDGQLFNLLKKELDENPNVRYLFSGSSVRLLSSIFLREDAPLYLMVSRHFMQPLDEESVVEFVAQRLAVAGLSASPAAAQAVFEHSGGIPFYIQKLGLLLVHGAWLDSEDEIDQPDVERAFARMLDELDGEFETRWTSRFSPQQRAILKTLARLGTARLTDIAAAMDARPTDISSAIGRMKDMLILAADASNGYAITDTVFSAWLVQD